eukprot:GEZU01027687.1.p1 GENE.GEZU01027687.1~~GEZU01027687.1.p1  ORF type:complete len:124 (-),score=6.02 GEZU01027687.1:34-405(-)
MVAVSSYEIRSSHVRSYDASQPDHKDLICTQLLYSACISATNFAFNAQGTSFLAWTTVLDVFAFDFTISLSASDNNTPDCSVEPIHAEINTDLHMNFGLCAFLRGFAKLRELFLRVIVSRKRH